ncbi:histidine kinase [Paenibacillus filicis]|uniref:histidine kinase n=1 Tax=Paenibacillus gyeongsangnamensis TaxID=3388067 RepID=A0ABT4QH73_9BACL|nr:histidine kinase [Paenibacillus filicis]MCZ8516200.1 histidine kinase [Paenibacillus filicis]
MTGRIRIKEWFGFRTVRSKLMAASVACILLPALLSLLIYNNLTQDAVRKQAVSNSQESLLLVNGYVTNLLKSMLNIANYVQTSPDMTTYFKQLVSGTVYTGEENTEYRRYTDTKRIIDQLDSFKTILDKSYITVLLTNGTVFTSYSTEEYNPLLFQEEPWFKQLSGLTGLQSYWTGATPTVFSTDKVTHKYQVSVVRTLRRDSTEIYGYVIVTVMEDEINKIFNRLTGSEDVMIVDGQGRIVSHRDTSRIGEVFPFVKSSALEASSDIVTIGGVSELVTQQTLPFTGWHLISLQSYKQAIANINTIFSKVFAFQLASFIVFLLLLLYLLKRVTNPLVRLGRTASSVQRGNLEVRSGVRGVDEIGRLGYSFDQMLDKVNEMIVEVSRTHSRKRRAELAMLQAQINPHFLFNVLNSIRMKVMHRGDPESAKMIAALSKLLRMTISQEKDEIALHEEFDLLSNYMELMNMRQKEPVELVFDVDVSSEAFLFKVPRFFLQPVVENALIHGLNRNAGTITVQARMASDGLLLDVRDDGTGMEADQLETLRRKVARGTEQAEAGAGGGFSGIGLPNVVERMKMTFGDEFRMDIESKPGEGTLIRMFIPRKEEAQNV